MTEDYRAVDIRAGPPTHADRIGLDQIPARDASELAAALKRAADVLEGTSLGASAESASDSRDIMIPNGWFG